MVYVFSGSIYECLGLEIYFPNGSGLLLLYLMPLLPPEFNIYISFTLRIVMTEIVGCIYIASYSKYSSWTFFTLKVHLLITRTLQCHALCLSTLISCQVCYFKHMCIELTRQGFGKEGLQQCPQWAELSRAPCQSRAALAAPKGPTTIRTEPWAMLSVLWESGFKEGTTDSRSSESFRWWGPPSPSRTSDTGISS